MDTMVIFPQMTVIKRLPGSTGNKINYVIDANASAPIYPGNMMPVKNIRDEQGHNTTVLDRRPGNFWTPLATAEEIANKTILQRIWANSRIIYKMDKAYACETCFPTLICPYKDITTLFPQVPEKAIINGALNMTHTEMHMRKIFWPVG